MIVTTTMSVETNTRLPSNLRPTTCECVHVVTRGHFRSRDKDGGYTIWSAVPKNPMLLVNLMALCFIEPLPIEVFLVHCMNRNFRPFQPDLDPITFIIMKLTRSVWRYAACANVNFVRQGFRKLSSDRHADTTKIIHIATCGWSTSTILLYNNVLYY